MTKYSDEEKAMWLEDWKRSGTSAWSYAKANGLNPATFKNWTRQAEGLRAEGQAKGAAQRFIEVIPQEPEAAPYIPEILIERGDIKIHIPVAMQRNDLRSIIESIGWQQ
jgi:transposase-like protein